MSTNPVPVWAQTPATAVDRSRVEQARARGTLVITWPKSANLRHWAKQQGWPTPWSGLKDAFLRKMLESDDTYALALRDSGVKLVLPIERYKVQPDELHELDALYAARYADGRPSAWGALVEALRELRRLVEAGVVVEIDGCSLRTWEGFYAWAHGRYHMLEDGYDRWIGNDHTQSLPPWQTWCFFRVRRSTMSASHAARLVFVITSLFLSALVVTCQHVLPVTTAPISPNGVIQSATLTEAARASISPRSDGAWTRTGADVARLEQDLLPFLQQIQHPWLRVDPPIWERAPDQKRHYLGLIVAGERLICADFFCQIDDRMDWVRELVFVLDDGDCDFLVTYKPESGEFRDFDVNDESQVGGIVTCCRGPAPPHGANLIRASLAHALARDQPACLASRPNACLARKTLVKLDTVPKLA